ncbi:MAG: C40 family peptidase [Ardenticatenales bacterium]|jgi:cell wall-associated NlpC family hydrolase|nr:C40 family peptidase [Ardenticatenales bacterium]
MPDAPRTDVRPPDDAPSNDAAMVDALTAAAERALAGVLEAWRARYGHVVADVRVARQGDGTPVLEGTVLVPAQRDALVRSVGGQLAAAGLDPARLPSAVVALTERAESEGWLRGVSTRPVPVRATATGDLSSELLPSDPPARRLTQVGDHTVVELADRTVGWVATADVTVLAPQHAPASVTAWRAGWAGAAQAASPGAWAEAVRPWLGVPYVLGGRSMSGIDCSAFVQHVVKAATGLGLPRHSSDQARFGFRVALDDVAAGDVVHVTHLERGTSHIVLVLGPTGAAATVAHACLDHGVVTVETLAAVLTRYAFRAARRFPPGYRGGA